MTALRESGLRSRIVRRLRARGWLPLVMHGSAYSRRGTSDVIACARGRFLAIEVKLPGERPRPDQERFLARVRQAGGTAGVAHSVREAEALVEVAVATDEQTLSLDDILRQLQGDAPPQVESPITVVAGNPGDAALLAEYDPDPPVVTEEAAPDGFSDKPTTIVEEFAVEPVFDSPMERVLAEQAVPTRDDTYTQATLDDVLARVNALGDKVGEAIDLMLKLLDKQDRPKATRRTKAEAALVGPATE